MKHLKQIFLLICFVLCSFSHAQDSKKNESQYIETLIASDSLQKAKSEITKQIEKFKAQKDYHSLSALVYLLGKIELAIDHKDNPLKHSLELASFIENNTAKLKTKHQLKIDLSKLFNEQGNPLEAYEHAKKSKSIALALKDDESLLNSDYYLSEYALRSGNINFFEQHTRDALKILEKNPSQKFKISARVYNYLGALMYFTSKPDSASYYYEIGLKRTIEMADNPENRLYFPATIMSNMVLLKQSQSKYAEAMQLIQESITLYKRFLTSTNNHPLTFRVHRNLSLAYRNLSSLYFDLGDYENAKKISVLAYKHAKDHLLPNSLENFSAITVLAEIKIPLKELESSLELLKEAELIADKIPGENFLLKANMYYIKGRIHQELKNYVEAKKYLELSHHLHQKAHPNEYSRDHLYTVLNLSLVLASLNEKEEAISILKNAYDYFLKSKGEQNNLTNAVMVALAKTSMLTEDYEQSLAWSNKSIALYEKYNNTPQNNYDKSHFEENKAEILVLNARSKYKLSKTKDSVFLKSILVDVKSAIHTLEERRALLSSVSDVNRLIEANQDAFDFAKQINLALYKATNNQKYLNDIVSLHESALYNRIRSRLNLKSNLTFTNVPQQITEREKTLKTNLSNSLNNSEDIETFLTAENNWKYFLDSLKVDHPKYFKMRYATIEQPIDNLQSRIPDHTTLIRYLFIDDTLYAFIITKTEKNLVKLITENLDDNILKLNTYSFNDHETSSYSVSLYNQLWKPLEDLVKTKHVIIIPDRQLFNLSFEMLTPFKIDNYSEMATNSLLSKYIISYNYSSLLTNKPSETKEYHNNFVAFVPEFNDQMKRDYQIAIKDSLELDKTYLTLLPQPFTKDLAHTSTRLFKGTSFLNERSTKTLFMHSAKEHKIIHIGTHAESNNISPELSRLVFAKSMDSTSTGTNYLYTYEIYNTNLSSNLAILTACETGKPSYQAGEGMISLAHAFNYAGSESILTSLWKIDEQSSAKIIESFYTYLKKGWTKDKALQQAKLDYISTADGRTAHPQYWAGLVLIGDTSPIQLQSSSNLIYWVLGGLCIVIIIVFLSRHRKTKKKSHYF